ncbi:MAG: SprT-like domain-containing protein [Pseudomonadota bacterium]
MKTTSTDAPTPQQFSAYQAMYDYFNRELFGGVLPPVILNFSRRARSLGFFAPERWDNGRSVTHEISLNPSYLKTLDPVEVSSTLVHEMVHLWQQEHGTPSRIGYHNAEWAEEMEALGLIPSDTGKPGGRKVGQHMAHYLDEDGIFAHAFRRMPVDILLPWQCIPEPDGEGGVGKSRKKVTYMCPGCAAKVWGRPGLVILCGPCGEPFEAAGSGRPRTTHPTEGAKTGGWNPSMDETRQTTRPCHHVPPPGCARTNPTNTAKRR